MAQGWAETSGRRVPDHAIWRRVGMTLVRPGGELVGDLRHGLEKYRSWLCLFCWGCALVTKINRQAKIKALQLAATTLSE